MAKEDARPIAGVGLPSGGAVLDSGSPVPSAHALIALCEAVLNHRWVIPAVPSYQVFQHGDHIYDDYMCTCRQCGHQKRVRVRPGELPRV